MGFLKELHALNAIGNNLSSELVTDPGFDNPTGIWTIRGSSFISGGLATVYPMGALNVTANNWAVYGDFVSAYLGQTLTFRVEFDVRDTTNNGGIFQVSCLNYGIDFNSSVTTNFTRYFFEVTKTVSSSTSNFTRLAFGGPVSSSIFQLDNVSMKIVL